MSKITKPSRELAKAMALGDGYINANGFLSIRHCAAQKDYLMWKKSLLNKSGIHTSDLYPVDNNGYGAFEIRTSRYDFLKTYRKMLYTPHKNISKPSILKNLSALHLAIWYMDDGHIARKMRNGKIHAVNLYLNTYTTLDDAEILIQYFQNEWGVAFQPAKDRGKYRLRCSTKETRKFLEIVAPYVNEVPCMRYKLL